MSHLVFLPRPPGGPMLFLWGRDPGKVGFGVIERLAALGRRGTARVITPRPSVERMSGFKIPLADGVAVLAGARGR